MARRIRVNRSESNTGQVTENSRIVVDNRSYNTMDDYIADYTSGFISEAFKNGKMETVTQKQLQDYLSSPEKYHLEISNLIKYQYITNGDIYQLHTLMQSLPSLKYKLEAFDGAKGNQEKNNVAFSKALVRAKYKELTRDLISQLNSEGTVVSMWIGDKKNPYLYVFNDINFFFPAYRRDGDWQCVADMEWFEQMGELEREQMFETLSPYITESDYNSFLNNKDEYRYVELPQERTTCLRINTMSRNQRLGLPMGTQSLFDILHKETLKTLEKTISDKIISNIAVLTVGNKEKPNLDIPNAIKKKVVQGVANVLKQSLTKKDLSCIVLPEYASIEWAKIDGLEGLKAEKFESVNADIATGIGVSPALTNGASKGTSNAKYNLEIIYKRVAMMLEQIDSVFNKLLFLVLPKNVADNLNFEFIKHQPLTTKEESDLLMKLSANGFSIKAVVDMITGVDFDNYITQSITEIEGLDLRNRIIPPPTSYTMTGEESDNKGGREKIENPDNQETIDSQEYGKNEPD